MSDDKILIIGAGGMLGHALSVHAGERAIGMSRAECNFLEAGFLQELERVYDQTPFAAVINAAAYTAVDAAEGEDGGHLLRINAVAPGEMASWCAKHDMPFVHFSTDYVFDGSGEKPWREDDD
ncbi:MAG: NAD-dependent epimerase/dehydratase family protein, partial [Alphaproteobacteria bacterium]|nr:NAD-dependent epimerase/dehydratase family protein [Alphaproteobacteria bacterium]